MQPCSNWIAKEQASLEVRLDKIAQFDEAASRERWLVLQSANLAQIDGELELLRARYDDYIESDAWRKKRGLVLKRANELCEGCGSRPATQVHHFTYVNLGDEFLWELAAVCNACHDRAHPWKLDDRSITAEMRRARLHRELESSPLFREYFSRR